MNKAEAIQLIAGGNIAQAARILGIDRKTIYNWPNELPQKTVDQIRGCHIRIMEERDRQAVSVFGEV